MKVKLCIVMVSSLILLSSSSFFLSDFLTQKIDRNDYSDAQFVFALKNNDIAALTIEEKKTLVGSIYWLRLNRELAKTQASAALRLARWYLNNSYIQTGIASTALSPILANTVNKDALIWFEQAIRLHSSQAIVELAQLYFQQDRVDKAQSTISKLPELLPNHNLDEAALRLRLTIAIYVGDINKVEQLVNTALLQQAKYYKGKYGIESTTLRLLADMTKFAIIKKNSLLAPYLEAHQQSDKVNLYLSPAANCLASLQLFATNVRHLIQLDQLIKRFNQQQPLARYICLPTPKYISIKQLKCSAKKHQAILCDESHWQHIVNEVDSRYIGLMLKEGGANVHLGILYFDSEDDVDVFSHEVSHLLGFVDEYPLTKEHDKCQGIQAIPFSHNIAVLKKHYQGDKTQLRAQILKSMPWANSIKATTPILQLVDGSSAKQQKWRLGTPSTYQESVGVYISESCHHATGQFMSPKSKDVAGVESISYSAFKPLNRRTQLRYFSADFPNEYLELIEAKPTAYLMPSFHYNIALALYQQGKAIDAKYWLDKAAQWESDPVKKAMVLNGGF
ncbi:tetratricopeptide repeat protein [Colwellia ponticola]|uniref:tetratricopeptide repeat protein n=1 Tax=Colwellia ponticola TaxID=2304625 RepID=UPI001FE9E69A|nr:hypothetical protein [Colwellia ponticola]